MVGDQAAHGRACEQAAFGHLADGIEQALLEVRALIGATVAEHREKSASDPAFRVVGRDVDAALEAMTKLVGRARNNVEVVLASNSEWRMSARSVLRNLARFAGDQVRVRLLCAPAVLDLSLLRAGDEQRAPFEARFGRISSLEAVVVDGRTALVRSDATCDGQAVVVRAAPVIRALEDLFADVWRNARPVAKPVDFGGRAHTEFAQRVLKMLYDGHTDEVAARELAVSVRTYRRYVAEIVELLGANSRFQAGVRAAEIGLLPAS
ncbi:hypothetical protein ACH347_16885 [Saccharopolyspora sp. 5N102]|uniref:hypothetical protein n=1 Tax=Saccharopolyspora sp. 5N102 TaxID=3375155 RepID=UPI00379B92CA